MQTTAALCSVLSIVLERLPAPFLRSNFNSAASVVCAVIEQHQREVRQLSMLLRAGLMCHQHLAHHSTQDTSAHVRGGSSTVMIEAVVAIIRSSLY